MSSVFKAGKKVAGSVFDPILGLTDGVVSGAGSLLGGGGGGSFADALKGVADPLLSGAPVPASAEAVPDMPLSPGVSRNDAAARSAEKRSREKQRRRSGRASTILTPFNVEREGLLGE